MKAGAGALPALVFVFNPSHMFQTSATTTQTFAQAISDADVKAWLKVDHDDDDALIGALRDAALHHIESHTGRTLRTSTFTITAPTFASIKRLPIGPVTNVTSLEYYPENDAALQTLASTEYTSALLGDVLHIAFRQTTPNVDPYRADAVKLTCGGGTRANEIAEGMRTAALLLVGHWYENRSAVHIGSSIVEMPIAVNALLAQYILQ